MKANEIFTETEETEEIEKRAIPTSVDWRTKGAVTPIKDQGYCGSCWAFTAVASLEGQIYRRKNKTVILSEQQLIDCSSSYGNLGCNGGWYDNGMDLILI